MRSPFDAYWSELHFSMKTLSCFDAFYFSDWATNQDCKEWNPHGWKSTLHNFLLQEWSSSDESWRCIDHNSLHIDRLPTQRFFCHLWEKPISKPFFLDSSTIPSAKNSCSILSASVKYRASNINVLLRFGATRIPKPAFLPEVLTTLPPKDPVTTRLCQQRFKIQLFLAYNIGRSQRTWEATSAYLVSIARSKFTCFVDWKPKT